jgi:hypothetical protein
MADGTQLSATPEANQTNAEEDDCELGNVISQEATIALRQGLKDLRQHIKSAKEAGKGYPESKDDGLGKVTSWPTEKKSVEEVLAKMRPLAPMQPSRTWTHCTRLVHQP